MNRTLVCLALYCGLCSFSAIAGPAEEEVFTAFEGACLIHIDDKDAIRQGAVEFKWQTIPKGFVLSQLLNGNEGEAWIVPGSHARMMVSLTTAGICSVFAPDTTGDGAIIEAHSKNVLLDTEKNGSQTENYYALTIPDQRGGKDRHAVVIVTFSNLASIPGIAYNAIPEMVAHAAGIDVPSWP